MEYPREAVSGCRQGRETQTFLGLAPGLGGRHGPDGEHPPRGAGRGRERRRPEERGWGAKEGGGELLGCRGGEQPMERTRMDVNLSLMLKEGWRNSSLAAIRAPQPSVTLFRYTRGVRPISCKTKPDQERATSLV
jgi:hypothetical protein